MKNFKKILVVVLVIAALSATAVLASFADDTTYTGTMDELSTLVDAVDAAEGTSALKTALVEVGEYLADTPVDPSSDGYNAAMSTVYSGVVSYINAVVAQSKSAATGSAKSAALTASCDVTALFEIPADTEGYSDALSALDNEAFACAGLLLDDIAGETVTGTAANGYAIDTLNAFVKKIPLNESLDGYAAYATEYGAKIALQDAAVEANKQAMLAKSTLSDYLNCVTVMDEDFTEDKHGDDIFNTKIGNAGTNGASSKDGYFTVTYGGTGTNGNTYAQQTFPVTTGAGATSNKGIVVDFDFKTDGVLPASGFSVEGGGTPFVGEAPAGYDMKNSSGIFCVYPQYFKFKQDGSIVDNSGKLLRKNGFVTGEWVHVTCIYDPVSFTFSLYIDYEFLDTYPANYYWKGSYTPMTYTLTCARFNGSTTEKAEFSLDNVQIYQGTALRDLNMLDKSKSELFDFYLGYLLDDTQNIEDRSLSYSQVSDLITDYWQWTDEESGKGKYLTSDEAIKASVDEYLDFLKNDYTEFRNALLLYNHDQFISKINAWKEYPRKATSENTSARDGILADIADFILKVGNDIYEDSDEYWTAKNDYTVLQSELTMDKEIINFNFNMLRIQSATTLYAYEKYYARATEALSVIDAGLAGKEGFEDFTVAYEQYLGIADIIDGMVRESNSKKIVACYDLISVYPEEEWIANYDYMNPYVDMIRTTIAEDHYDVNYEGVLETIAEFEYMDKYFYSVLQQIHIEELTECLDYIMGSDAYIDKMGVCAYITRYLETNDIDYTNSELVQLITNYETVLAELELREEDYEVILEQNAYYFISLVEKMSISESYAAQKALYDQAEVYYFALNAGIDGVADAIKVFDEYTDILENVEGSSSAFLSAVAVLQNAATEDEKYAALVECYAHSRSLETSIDGVSEALEIYTAAYEEYNSMAKAVNGDIATAGVIMGSVRTNCGVKSVVAVIVKKLFE